MSIPGYDAWKTRAPEDEPGYEEPEEGLHFDCLWCHQRVQERAGEAAPFYPYCSAACAALAQNEGEDL